MILAFAWAAYPFTDYALQSNSNDTLIAALLVWALVLFALPVWRGVLLAPGRRGQVRASASRAPLRDRPDGTRGARPTAREGRYAASPDRRVLDRLRRGHRADGRAARGRPGAATFYDRTVKSQLDRTSPFSVWGQDHSLEWLQTVVKTLTVALAIVVAFVPRRRSLVQVAALAAAVMIAVQLVAEHWFYLYIPWFCGLAFPAIAFSTRRSSSPTDSASSVASAPGRRLAKVAASER